MPIVRHASSSSCIRIRARRSLVNVGIVGTLVVNGVNHNTDVIASFCQQGERTGAAKGVVVGMRGEQQDGLCRAGFRAMFGVETKVAAPRGGEIAPLSNNTLSSLEGTRANDHNESIGYDSAMHPFPVAGQCIWMVR
jgi:hypothetical protein